jgi:hypothetical protein
MWKMTSPSKSPRARFHCTEKDPAVAGAGELLLAVDHGHLDEAPDPALELRCLRLVRLPVEDEPLDVHGLVAGRDDRQRSVIAETTVERWRS